MSGTIKVNSVQLGDSTTATQNFTLRTNQDGTATLARGNVGVTSQDVLTVAEDGKVSHPQGLLLESINGGQLAGMRNRIINGDCNIAQRGTSAVFNSGSAVFNSGTTGYYGGPDRFKTYVNPGTAGQFTQTQSTLGNGGAAAKVTVRQTVNTVNTDFTVVKHWAGIYQWIEGVNCCDLVGKPITISFIFNTNVTGTYSVALLNGASTHSYVTSFTASANVPTKVVVNVPAFSTWAIGNSTGPGLEVVIGFLNTGTYQTSNLNTFQPGILYSAAGATNWAAAVGNFIELTELQLEEGTVATPFERRSYGFELSLCQRYYEVLPATIYGSYSSPNASYAQWSYKQTKRVLPTITGLSGSMIIDAPSTHALQVYIVSGYAHCQAGTIASAEL